MRKALLIYNSKSGGNRFQQPDSILECFKFHQIHAETFFLSGEDIEQPLIDTLTRQTFDLVVISGGDGTINFVANSLLKNEIKLPMGIIPAGTSNDLARNLKLPLDQKTAVGLIASGETKTIDVGLVNEAVYFLSSCAGGLFTDISYRTEIELKKSLGPLAYYLKGLQELSQIKPFRLTVKTDTETITEDTLLFFILNGPHVAGLSDLVESADPADGYLHLMLIKTCDPLELTGLFFNILGHISLRSSDKVVILKASAFELSSDRDITLSVDGERNGRLPAKLSIQPRQLTVFSPVK